MSNLVPRVVLVVWLTATLSACTPAPDGDGEVDPVVVGLAVPNEAAAQSAVEWGEALAQELGHPVEVEIAPHFNALLFLMSEGEIDLAVLTAFNVVTAMDDLDATPLAIAERNGGTTYRSQINARCDLEYSSLAELPGARFAFVAAGSHSGHLFPYLTLLNAGVDPAEDLDASFAGSHDGVILGIYQDDYDAGASFDDARGLIAHDHPDVHDVVCVLGYTDPIPNEAVVAAAHLDTELAASIAEALWALADDPDVVAVMQQLFNADALHPVPTGTYDIVRDAMALF